MTADDAAPPAIWSNIIDRKAKEAPDSIFCELLEENWRQEGSRIVTYAQIARAINRACWWLEAEFGPSNDFDAFAYVGDNDLRYTIAMVAAQKTERTVTERIALRYSVGF